MAYIEGVGLMEDSLDESCECFLNLSTPNDEESCSVSVT